MNDVGFHLPGRASSGESCLEVSLPRGAGSCWSVWLRFATGPAAGTGGHGDDFQPPRGASFLSEGMELHLHRALPCPQASLPAISLPQERSLSLRQLEHVIIHEMKSISATFLLKHYGL